MKTLRAISIIISLLILFAQLVVLFAPDEKGSVGLYLSPFILFVVFSALYLWVGQIITIILFGLISNNITQTIQLAVVAIAIFLMMPILARLGHYANIPMMMRDPQSLTVGSHVYYLHTTFMRLAHTMDAATEFSYVMVQLYECDSLGLVCRTVLYQPMGERSQLIRMEYTGSSIRIFSDRGDIQYPILSPT